MNHEGTTDTKRSTKQQGNTVSKLERNTVAAELVETIVSNWVTAKILADPGLTGGEKMSAVSLFFEPGHGHARHNHPESEQIIYVIAGEGEMMIEEPDGTPVKTAIRAGSLVQIPRGAFHSTFNTGWEPIRILAIYSPPGPEAAMRTSQEFEIFPAGTPPIRK